jgi:hypothetical protein
MQWNASFHFRLSSGNSHIEHSFPTQARFTQLLIYLLVRSVQSTSDGAQTRFVVSISADGWSWNRTPLLLSDNLEDVLLSIFTQLDYAVDL